VLTALLEYLNLLTRAAESGPANAGLVCSFHSIKHPLLCQCTLIASKFSLGLKTKGSVYAFITTLNNLKFNG